MRFSCAVAASVVLGLTASTALAQSPPPGRAAMVIRQRDIGFHTGCDWIADDGKWKLQFYPGAERPKDLPPNAYCFHSRRFEFPGFSIAEVHFEKGTKTPLEFHAVDTTLYVERGHARNMVENMVMESSPGDVAFHNTGAWHQNEALSDDYVQIEIKVPHVTGDSNSDKKGLDIDKFPRQVGAIVHGADAPVREICDVPTTNGEGRFVPRTPETAKDIPKNAGCFSAKYLSIRPSGVLLELAFKKGTKTLLHQDPAVDAVFRVASGHVRIEGGMEAANLEPGDAVLYPAGVLHKLTASDDAMLLEFQMVAQTVAKAAQKP